MSGTRPNSTNTIQAVLDGKNLEIAGNAKCADGKSEAFAGICTLSGLLGIAFHVARLHHPLSIAGSLAYLGFTTLGAYWTINGVAKSGEGKAMIEEGQQITKEALAQPDMTINSMIVLFKPAEEKAAAPVNDTAPELSAPGFAK